MKKANSSLILVLVMALISFLCLSLSVSYSYIYSSNFSSSSQSIRPGNLNGNISYSSITTELSPMSDEDGLNKTEYSTITINNSRSYGIYYNISLGYNLDSVEGRTLDELLPLEHVKVALLTYEKNRFIPTLLTGPVAIGDLPLNESSDNVLNDSYSLYIGSMEYGIASQRFILKVWLDSEISDNYNYRQIYLGAKIRQEPIISKNIYTLSGAVTLDGNPVEGAEISLHNGSKKATVESGSYTLNEIIEGTYNLKVTLTSGRAYETTVNIRPGTAVSVSENATTPGNSGTFIQKAAYNNYTTPLKIIKYNGLTTDSNKTTTVGYNMPRSYSIIGREAIDTQNLNGININLTSAGDISLSKG